MTAFEFIVFTRLGLEEKQEEEKLNLCFSEQAYTCNRLLYKEVKSRKCRKEMFA